VAALRALLTGNFDEHTRLAGHLDDVGMRDYMTLVSAAFLDAVGRRFAGKDLPAAVIDYVGQVGPSTTRQPGLSTQSSPNESSWRPSAAAPSTT
jgi:hypothetical protein